MSLQHQHIAEVSDAAKGMSGYNSKLNVYMCSLNHKKFRWPSLPSLPGIGHASSNGQTCHEYVQGWRWTMSAVCRWCNCRRTSTGRCSVVRHVILDSFRILDFC